MNADRRWFLQSATALGAAFRTLPLAYRTGAPARDDDPVLGPLQPDADGILDLPQEFSYQVLSRTGDEMDDGLLVPGAPDGMATFPDEKGRTILIRNHELMPGTDSPFGPNDERLDLVDPDLVYDAGGSLACGGGTTTLVYDTATETVERQFLSLAGTLRNCAGGPTPWGSWITCEEAPVLANEHFAKDHGYAFEVPASAQGPVAPVPLRDLGRFNHEAAAVHEESSVVYMTEDRPDGLLYRFRPKRKGDLTGGGRLQALAILDAPSTDTRNWYDFSDFPVGMPVEVEWIDLDDIEAPRDDLRQRGFLAGAARFARGEGMWTGEDSIWFACTNGGRARAGQIFRYRPGPDEGRLARETKNRATLELHLESPSKSVLDACDNLTVTPWGDLLVCEDGGGPNHLVRVTSSGQVHPFARTTLSELCGATFSPDGTTLFVNVQRPGITLAIRGPWPRS